MRIRKRKTLKRKNKAIVFLYLTPLIGTLIYASVVLYILYDLNSFTFKLDPPNTDYFYKIASIVRNGLSKPDTITIRTPVN